MHPWISISCCGGKIWGLYSLSRTPLLTNRILELRLWAFCLIMAFSRAFSLQPKSDFMTHHASRSSGSALCATTITETELTKPPGPRVETRWLVSIRSLIKPCNIHLRRLGDRPLKYRLRKADKSFCADSVHLLWATTDKMLQTHERHFVANQKRKFFAGKDITCPPTENRHHLCHWDWIVASDVFECPPSFLGRCKISDALFRSTQLVSLFLESCTSSPRRVTLNVQNQPKNLVNISSGIAFEHV